MKCPQLVRMILRLDNTEVPTLSLSDIQQLVNEDIHRWRLRAVGNANFASLWDPVLVHRDTTDVLKSAKCRALLGHVKVVALQYLILLVFSSSDIKGFVDGYLEHLWWLLSVGVLILILHIAIFFLIINFFNNSQFKLNSTNNCDSINHDLANPKTKLAMAPLALFHLRLRHEVVNQDCLLAIDTCKRGFHQEQLCRPPQV